MKKIYITFIIQLFVSFLVIGQDLHSPAEILLILEKSPLTYELNILEDKIEPMDRSDNLNYNHGYRKIDGDRILTLEYKLSEEGMAHSKSAEENFKNQKMDEAREKYLEVLKTDPEYYKVMTYVGQTFGIQDDFDKAIEWYHKSIDKNYIDYMAHWFLADAYKKTNQKEKALEEITIAMILNRNNPRIKKSFNDIYKMNDLETPEWVFTPQIRISSEQEEKVKIEFNEDWLAYGLAKAVWKYEPNYKESMGVKEGTFSTLEEREAIVNLVSGLEKKKIKKVPEFKALSKAIENGMLNEYIFYEIVLPEYPQVAFQLQEDFIKEIGAYILAIRGEKK